MNVFNLYPALAGRINEINAAIEEVQLDDCLQHSGDGALWEITLSQEQLIADLLTLLELKHTH